MRSRDSQRFRGARSLLRALLIAIEESTAAGSIGTSAQAQWRHESIGPRKISRDARNWFP